MNYKFLIYISYSYALPIGNPLEVEILRRGDTVMWYSDLNDGKLALENKSNVLNTIKDVVNYKPHIVLAATNDVPDFISGLKVQIFHGFNAQKRPEGNNSFSHYRIRGFFDLYCTQGPTTTSGFKAEQKKHPHFEVKETGWSKVDPLFPIVKKEKNSLPTIMIASTFSKRLSLALNNDVFETIKILAQSRKYNFIMVLHPKLPIETKEKWKSLEGKHFKYYDTTDLVPLFKKANIMFADTTSAIQEFLLQKKPVVSFNHTFNHDYLIHVNDAAKLEERFEYALSYPENLLKNIEIFINQLHPYNDGKSSQRVIEACITYLHQDKTHIKNKPLNLIRKYKIRKRLGYFTFKSYNKPYTITVK
ncbi:CDP-glycerol glycerophosphotransferase family protein [Winogradskyella litoriviva]|uniref:CDP-glycerol glycerophosphotransferase family protein n=1 Tax=Winogradskyella litoriviva TaxID=1220182 RepID=A0ABX2E6Y1_9FLAO|nr:CDP-glycerol glycerophosphotransferase family protein [Winogradskyella litoriviva]NRD23892.1 CDP-glycerol glycerophosphotransferase family protein [Winogradskyella litoriviva]